MTATPIGKIQDPWTSSEVRVEFIADPFGNEYVSIGRYEDADEDMPLAFVDVELDQLDHLIRLLNMSKLLTLTADDLKEMLQ